MKESIKQYLEELKHRQEDDEKKKKEGEDENDDKDDDGEKKKKINPQVGPEEIHPSGANQHYDNPLADKGNIEQKQPKNEKI